MSPLWTYSIKLSNPYTLPHKQQSSISRYFSNRKADELSGYNAITPKRSNFVKAIYQNWKYDKRMNRLMAELSRDD